MASDEDHKSDSQDTETFDQTKGQPPTLQSGATPQESVPESIGRYKIQRVISSGGMGTVYEATQENPRRSVAVKVLKHGVTSRSALRRFAQESEVLGRLQHSGIAQIYEAGMADSGSGPQPFFAMEYIRGRTLREHVELNRLGTRQRLELVTKICDAVNHAHQKGVIHRDLKPGNIIVDESGQPKILDFGIARTTDSDLQATTMRTDVGQLVGTLSYMSPEQVAADPAELDTRSDVYALGVIVYELLAEKHPYDLHRKMIHEAVRVIREENPTPLSSVNRVFRGDVEIIVAKALEKEKTRRYQSATELSADIRRYLADEPIVARPPSTVYQLGKFAKRNKALVGGAVAVVVALAAGLVTSTAMYWQAETAREATAVERDRAVAAELEADRRRVEAEQARQGEQEQRLLAERNAEQANREAGKAVAVTDFLRNMLSAVDPLKSGYDVTVAEILDKAAEGIDTAFPNEPDVEVVVRDTIASSYESLGLYDRAVPHAEWVLTHKRQSIGSEDVETLREMKFLAGLYVSTKTHVPKARQVAEEGLAIARRTLGDDHETTIDLLDVLGNVMMLEGLPFDAEPLHRESLKWRQEHLGEQHVATSTSMFSLGASLMAQYRFAEAEPFYRKTMEIRLSLLGEEHPWTLAVQRELAAYVLLNLNKLDEAEEILRATLKTCRRVLGNEHFETITSMDLLCAALARKGQLEEAVAFCKEGIEWRVKVVGEDHPEMIEHYRRLGRILFRLDRVDQCRVYLRKYIAIRRRLAERPDATVMDLNNFAMTALVEDPPDLRDPAAALVAAKRACELTEYKNPLILDTLALAHKETGDLNKAIETQQKAVSLAPPGESALRDGLEGTLVGFLRDKGDLAGAEQIFRDALQRKRNNAPDNGAAIGSTLIRLGMFLLETDRPDKAEPVLRECVEVRRGSYPEGHWLIANTMSVMGESLLDQGKYAEAEPVLLEAHTLLTANPEAPAPRQGDSLLRLVKLYEAWNTVEPNTGKAEKAAEWRAKQSTGGEK